VVWVLWVYISVMGVWYVDIVDVYVGGGCFDVFGVAYGDSFVWVLLWDLLVCCCWVDGCRCGAFMLVGVLVELLCGCVRWVGVVRVSVLGRPSSQWGRSDR